MHIANTGPLTQQQSDIYSEDYSQCYNSRDAAILSSTMAKLNAEIPRSYQGNNYGQN